MKFFKYLSYLALLLQLFSCASPYGVLEGATVHVAGANSRVTLAANSTPGTYTLETVLGEFLASAEYQPVKTNIPLIGAKGMFWFRIDERRLPYDIASSCMRIRTPNNQFLPVNSGVVNLGILAKEKFRIPTLEYNVIRNNTIPQLSRAISTIDSNISIRANAQQWLDNQTELYVNNRCIRPNSGPKPDNVCTNRRESNAMYKDYCFSANVSCSVASSAVMGGVFENFSGRVKDYENLAEQFSKNACSLMQDKRYRQQTDWWAIARSFLISEASSALYRRLINENPSLEEKVLLDSAVAVANYQLCLDDNYSACSRRKKNWLRSSLVRQQKCLNQKKVFDRANAVIERYGDDIGAMNRQLGKYQDRLKELQSKSNGWNKNYFRTVHSCQST